MITIIFINPSPSLLFILKIKKRNLPEMKNAEYYKKIEKFMVVENGGNGTMVM